jgi:hypothetical protein
MLPRLLGGVVLSFCAIAASAPLSAAPAGDPRLLPMRFELLQEGPANLCGEICRTWVSAIGAITRDTPTDFAGFARNHDLNGATLVLDSSGGSVLGTLALGRAIRSAGLMTTVGKIRKLSGEGADDRRATLSPQADCESMCAFLLLAGKQRFVPPEAQVLVHEIWLGDRREDAAAATYSAEDIVIVQRDIGRLAQYTVEMGGSIDLLEIALRIPPWEPMRKLSPAELRRIGLDTVTTLSQADSQTIAVSPGAPVRQRMPATERGWTVSDKAGQATLRRRHPLTIEGDEIGNFDVIFACADTPGSYDVTYVEKRHGPNVQPVTEALTQVTIAVGRKLIPLEIVTSVARPSQADLDSVARGLIPAALVESLARDGSRSLTVTTATTRNVETVIRVGNTGVLQNLPRLAANCPPPSPPRADTHAELLPQPAVEAGSIGQPR